MRCVALSLSDISRKGLVVIGCAPTGADGLSGRRRPPIPLELTTVTGLKHLEVTLSRARAGPNIATDELFICIGAQTALDLGGVRNPDGPNCAAFGQVTAGVDVARAILYTMVTAHARTPPIATLDIIRW